MVNQGNYNFFGNKQHYLWIKLFQYRNVNRIRFCNKFPIIIAEGTPAEAGVDGSIHYTYDFTTTVDRSEGFNFREVMRIPTVQAGDKIAEIIPPTTGEVG